MAGTGRLQRFQGPAAYAALSKREGRREERESLGQRGPEGLESSPYP